MFKIIQRAGLNKDQYHAVRSISKIAELNDRVATPLYWNLIKNSRATNGDLLYIKSSHNIAGYLGYFLFEDGIAEVTAVVDPHHRNEGIFSELFDYAISQLRRLRVDTIRFRTPANVISTQKTLRALNAQYDHAEYQLLCEQFKPMFQISPVNLVEANIDLLDDILKLNQVDELPLEEQLIIRTHFKKIIQTEDRKCFIGYYRHKPIGIIHAQIDAQGIHLHDFNFAEMQPESQFKFDFLNKVMFQLHQITDKPFTFVVKENQWACFDQFFKQGFSIAETIEYWKMPIAEHERTVRKTEKLVN